MKVIKFNNPSSAENALEKEAGRQGFNERDFQERKKSLLKELYNEGRKSEFSDEREKFSARKGLAGDDNHTLIATRQLEKKYKKRKRSFNLDEEAEDVEDGEDYATHQSAGGDLEFTHQGKSISLLDDKSIQKYNADTYEGDDDELGDKYNHSRKVNDNVLDEKNMPGFFFGQGNPDDVNNPTKSRQEIFKEIMQKSKLAKMEMKKHRETLEEELASLDDAFSQVQSMLSFKPSRKDKINSLLKNVNNAGDNSLKPNQTVEEVDDYEQLRNILKFDTRTGVSDRIKTDEEIAKINAERLEKLEKERKERMSLTNSNADADFSTGSENEEGDDDEVEDFKNELEEEQEDETESEEGDEGELEEEQEDENEPEEEDEDELEEEQDENEPEEEDGGELEEEDENESEEGDDDELEKEDEKKRESSKPSIKHFLEFELEPDENIDWMVNDETESNLPFSVNLKRILKEYDLKGLMDFMIGFSPKSQWKLINRFRSCFNKGDTVMMNDLKLLLGFLVKYPLMCLRQAESETEKSHIFRFITNYLKLMSGHLLFMAETDPKECLIIFTYFTFEICHSTFPSIYHKHKRIEKFLNEHLLNIEDENYYTEILEECPSLYQLSEDAYELTLEHIVICRIMFILFPITDAQHPILTPILVCLEQWAHRWSQIGKSFLNTAVNPDQDGELVKYNQVRLAGGNSPNISCMVGVISLLEMSSIGYVNSKSQNNTENDVIERFSIGYFSLSLSCLKWLVSYTSNTNTIVTPEKRMLLSIGILKSILRVISAFKNLQGFHAIILHLVHENIHQVRESLNMMSDCGELLDLISRIKSISTEITNKPQTPVNLCPRQTPTIRSLIPKIDDPSVPFAAKAMLKARHGPKESQYELEKRLYISRMRKEVNTARRQANRQLRKDSQVIASVWHEKKTDKSKKQNAKYNSFMKMLEDDQAEYKRMKTTGGTMDTSIQSYRANKQAKKKNQRMAGNKTANGIVH